MERLYLEFLESDICNNCGSQRCDQSIEWVDGCPKWKEFLNQHTKEKVDFI